MKLLTLGGLGVEGAAYRREKPLLLLAYLSVEGTQTRKHLAGLFWPDAANPMNSLAQNLIRLRPLGDVLRENDKWVEPLIGCDAADFRAHHRAGRVHEAAGLYKGAFLHGVRDGLNPDLEEWLLDTRTALGAEARSAHLSLAEHHHARGEMADAARHADLAYSLPGADPIDPEDIPRVWRLLGSPDHPLAVTLRREAGDFGLTLPVMAEPSPAPVSIVGRHAELETLRALQPGQVAWVSGPPGIGKTALLGALAAGGGWRVLPGVNGLPLGTMEPLSPHPLGSTADALNALRDARLELAIDGWEDCDETTRAALTLAARQHPGAALVIAAREPPAVPVERHLPLHSLSEQDLQAHPGAHAATGGHPVLLAAHLRGAPPTQTLDAHLTLLGDVPRRMFLALAAQDTPHLNATRAALALPAAAFAGSLDMLAREGLTTPTGTIRATTPARALLDAQPLDTALLHLHLARAHPKESGWPHWLKARDLWEGEDEQACAAAAHWYADQEMKRGYPAKAARTLEVAPQTDEVKLLRGWALVKNQRPDDVLRLIADLSESPDVLALRATALVYASRGDEAAAMAVRIPRNATPAHAHAENVLGYAARQREDIPAARGHYRAAVSLWKMHDEQEWIEVASVLAAVQAILGENPDDAFRDVLVALSRFPMAASTVYPNYAHALKHVGRLTEAQDITRAGLQVAQDQGDTLGELSLRNSLGVFAHLSGNLEAAAEQYSAALRLAHRCGNLRAVGLAASNLAEVEGDAETFADTMSLLRRAGHDGFAERIEKNLAERVFATAVRSRSGHEADAI